MAARKPGSPKTAGRKPAAATTRQAAAKQTPLLEWVSAAVGLALTLAVIGVIGWEALNADDSPPAIVVERLAATRTASGYVLEVKVTNTGGSPAAQVAIEGELTPSGGEPETAEATFDYVPDHSTRTGGLFFESDPNAGALKLTAKGYVSP
jgi:uncharacterized protein (TIGR02588 family)